MKKNAPELIDEISKSRTFNRPADLAEAYLSHKETLPLFLQSLTFLKTCKLKASDTNKKIIRKNFQEFIATSIKEVSDKISKDTLKDIKENYDKKTVNKILEALLDFEPFLKGSPVSVVSPELKRFYLSHMKTQRNIINAIEFLLKSANLSDSEKKMLQRIKTRHQDSLKQSSQVKKVVIDPVKEALLNVEARAANGTLLTGLNPSGTMDFIMQCNFPKTIFIKPTGRPKKKIFLNALVIVIYSLLKNDNTQVKWRYCLTANIINQYFGLTGKEALNSKGIDNALHSR